MIWFFVPASLVICNDCFAYIFGVLFGRTPLIKLSPKKTVEGFVGAFISTMLFSLVWGTFFARFDYMICPVQNLGVNAFNATSCTPNPVFVWRPMNLWKPLAILFKTLVCSLEHNLYAWPLIYPHTDISRYSNILLYPIPDALLGPRHICVARGSIWRVFRVWFQTRVQHQGLRR